MAEPAVLQHDVQDVIERLRHCIGMFVLLSNLWILLLTPACAWALHRFAILPEERYLERKFGQPYNAYRRRVRRWL